MHAIEGGKGKCLTLIQVRVLREVRDKTKPFLSKNEAWYSQHNVVGGGGGWPLSRPVVSLRRTPKMSQKWLKGKNGKFCHSKQYKML